MFYKWTSLLWRSRKRLKLIWAILKDGRVPLWQKAIPFLPLIYILSPFNFLTFAIPVLGQVDDVLLILLALDLTERLIDDKIIMEYKAQQEEMQGQ